VSGSDGSTTLTREQGDWFYERYGVRYVQVQTRAEVPSRRVRRALKKRKQREA